MFITTALDNGASLEEVQSAAGHADLSPQSSLIVGGTIRRRARAFLRIIEKWAGVLVDFVE